MSNIINYREDLISYIKSIILKYCPYTDDRLSMLDNEKQPELDIELNICKDKTQIMFIFGNKNFKVSVLDRAVTSYIISFEEISDVIDYLLDDHEVIKSINFDDKEISLKFAINWTEKSIKGINCNDIGLNLTFENMQAKKQYLYLLIKKYYDKLEQTSSFKSIKNAHINKIKQLCLESLEKNELITILNKMNENELYDLMSKLDNDIFERCFSSYEQPTKTKKISQGKYN